MSQKQLQRIKMIENAVQGRITVAEASQLLRLSERQVKRLKARYQPDTVAWGRADGNAPGAVPQSVRRRERKPRLGMMVRPTARATNGWSNVARH